MLQQFLHIRSLYCLFCNPPSKITTNFHKIYYYRTVRQLLGHLRGEHTSFMCELCLTNATLFIDEQRVFRNNKQLLLDHEQYGSEIYENYGETAPHPFCTLCRKRFYGKDILFNHCETQHFSCHFCRRSGRFDFFVNIQLLEDHYRTQHHLCEHPKCMKMQYVVFDDPVHLQSHQLGMLHRMTGVNEA